MNQANTFAGGDSGSAAPHVAEAGSAIAKAVHRLKGVLENSDPGTLAALRRASPLSPPAAFYRLSVGVLDEVMGVGAERSSNEEFWITLASVMACGVGLLARVPLGEALAKAGVAEMRVLRLLEARDAQLPQLLRNLVHQLVQKGQPFDPVDVADLLLCRDEEERRKARQRIARFFFRHADT